MAAILTLVPKTTAPRCAGNDFLLSLLQAELKPGLTVEAACHARLIMMKFEDQPSPRTFVADKLLLAARGIEYHEPDPTTLGWVSLAEPEVFMKSFPKLAHIAPYVVACGGVMLGSNGEGAERSVASIWSAERIELPAQKPKTRSKHKPVIRAELSDDEISAMEITAREAFLALPLPTVYQILGVPRPSMGAIRETTTWAKALKDLQDRYANESSTHRDKYDAALKLVGLKALPVSGVACRFSIFYPKKLLKFYPELREYSAVFDLLDIE